MIEGFKHYRLEMTSDRGGRLVYLKDEIISKELNKGNISSKFQVIPLMENMNKQT